MKAIVLPLLILSAGIFACLAWLMWPASYEGRADYLVLASLAFGGLAFWIIVLCVFIVLSERGGRC